MDYITVNGRPYGFVIIPDLKPQSIWVNNVLFLRDTGFKALNKSLAKCVIVTTFAHPKPPEM